MPSGFDLNGNAPSEFLGEGFTQWIEITGHDPVAT